MSEFTTNALEIFVRKDVLATLVINFLIDSSSGVSLAAHNSKKENIIIPRGLNDKEAWIRPSESAAIARVVPQAGQGYPVNNLKMQIVGPWVNP